MTATREPLSRDSIVALRSDYAARELTVDAICTRHGTTRDILYYWVDGGEPEGDLHFPPLPRRGKAARSPQRPRRFQGNPAGVARRLWRTAEAQIFEIERRLIGDQQQPDERERDARTLAVVARMLRDLAALEAARLGGEPTPVAGDDAGPEDIDEFRRKLVRRMDEIVARRQAGAGGGVQSG